MAGSWRPIPAPAGLLAPAPRGGAALAALGGGTSLLLFGGADRTARAFDDLWQLSLGRDGGQAEWTRISCSFPPGVACTARSGAALVAVGGRVYLFGGQEPRTGLCFNDVLELDPGTWTWAQLPVEGARPPARHSCVAAAFRDQCIIVFGGAGQRGALSDVWVFNCADQSWSCPRVGGEHPAAREMAAGAVLGGGALLVHGGRAADGRVLDDVVVLHTGEEWAWHGGGSVQLPRCAHTLAALPAAAAAAAAAERLLVFGGFSGAEVEGSLWQLLPPAAAPTPPQQDQQEQEAQPAEVPEACGAWSAKQLHPNGASGGGGFAPAPRFAHVAACLRGPGGSAHTPLMVVLGGCCPAEDLMDAAAWAPSEEQQA